MAYLQVETPEGVRRVSLESDRLTLGRLPSNDVMLPYPQVSRHHAELRRAGEEWWIADLQSTNGVRVRGARVERSSVLPGDLVQLAPGIILKLVAGDAPGDLSVMPTTAMPAVGPRTPPAYAAAADVLRQAAPDVRAAVDVPAAPDTLDAPIAPTLPPPLPVFTPALPDTAPAARSSSPPLPWPTTLPPWDAPAHPAGSTVGPQPSWPPADAFGWAGTYSGVRGPDAGAASVAGDGTGAGDDPLEGDLFRRKRARRLDATTAGPAPTGDDAPFSAAVMLHLCQTCGQLTAPDVVCCQTCGHAIARPCRACGLSILPIHDCCPRCQAPNPASVLRSHRRRAGGSGGA